MSKINEQKRAEIAKKCEADIRVKQARAALTETLKTVEAEIKTAEQEEERQAKKQYKEWYDGLSKDEKIEADIIRLKRKIADGKKAMRELERKNEREAKELRRQAELNAKIAVADALLLVRGLTAKDIKYDQDNVWLSNETWEKLGLSENPDEQARIDKALAVYDALCKFAGDGVNVDAINRLVDKYPRGTDLELDYLRDLFCRCCTDDESFSEPCDLKEKVKNTLNEWFKKIEETGELSHVVMVQVKEDSTKPFHFFSNCSPEELFTVISYALASNCVAYKIDEEQVIDIFRRMVEDCKKAGGFRVVSEEEKEEGLLS